MTRPLSRTALELSRAISTRLPPTYLLPVRARWSSTTTTTTTAAATPASSVPILDTPVVSPAPKHKPNNLFTPKARPPSRKPPTVAPPLSSDSIPQSIKDALPLLRAQPGHYITFHIHGRPYLVTPGDTVRLPFLMPGVVPGDVLRLNRVSVLGSRDFTIKPSNLTPKANSNEPAYIDERLYTLRAIVTGVDAEPMREMQKTKRRNRKVKTVKSKHRYTVLSISELKITNPDELP